MGNQPLKAIQVSESVWWVGAIDWGVRDFHGYATKRGTTYNAFLVTGDRPVLVDTVKPPFFGEMLARIASVLDPSRIEILISNHSEMDHSGEIPTALRTMPIKECYASERGVKALEEHFRLGGRFTVVKEGQELTLGGRSFKFLETRMLHWPDSMFTWLADDGVLFAHDGFGMHLATAAIFDDQNPWTVLEEEAAKYFANIFLPLLGPLGKLLERLPQLNLPIRIVAPDHGPIWRTHFGRILECYQRWARREATDKVVVAYDTMWQSTAAMARAIADGVVGAGGRVVVMPLGSSHRSDIVTQLLDAGGLAVGSPTLNNNLFPTVADLMCYLRGLKVKNLQTVAFGSYGWSGEAVGLLEKQLQDLGLPPVATVKQVYVPGPDGLVAAREAGGKLIAAIRGSR